MGAIHALANLEALVSVGGAQNVSFGSAWHVCVSVRQRCYVAFSLASTTRLWLNTPSPIAVAKPLNPR